MDCVCSRACQREVGKPVSVAIRLLCGFARILAALRRMARKEKDPAPALRRAEHGAIGEKGRNHSWCLLDRLVQL